MEISERGNNDPLETKNMYSCRHLCQDAAQVYDPKARPWIRPENATTQELINQVANCPSAALTIQIDDAENEIKA